MYNFKLEDFKANDFLLGKKIIDTCIKNNEYFLVFRVLSLAFKIISHKNLQEMSALYVKIHELILKKYNLDLPFEFHENEGLFSFSFNFYDFYDEDFFLKLSSQDKWVAQHDFIKLFEKYDKINHTDLEKQFTSRYLLEKAGISSNQIVKKKFKYYNGATILTFGEYMGETFDQIFSANPNIIKSYFNNLSHFIPVFSFWFRKDVLATYKKDYWDLFEKYLIKIHISQSQSKALSNINYLERRFQIRAKEYNKQCEDDYRWAFGNDASNLWNVD